MTERAAFSLVPADVPLLRVVIRKLAATGYSERRVRERLGLEDLADLQWRHLPIYRSHLRAQHLAIAIHSAWLLIYFSCRALSPLTNSRVCSLLRNERC